MSASTPRRRGRPRGSGRVGAAAVGRSRSVVSSAAVSSDGTDASSINLTHYSVRPSTLRLYTNAARAFFRFSCDRGLPLITSVDVDDALIAYINYRHGLYQAWLDDDCVDRPPHSSRGEMEWAIAGCEFLVPSLFRRLRGARRAVAGWKRLHPVEHHPPLSWPITVLLASTLAKSGRTDMAIAALLSFDCYLRVSEFTSIRRQDVVVSSHPFRVAIRLSVTKTRMDESVIVARSTVAELLTRLIYSSNCSSTGLVFPFTPSEFRFSLRQACISLRLRGSYVPHSLRGGGATHDFSSMDSSRVDINYIMIRGRWTSADSLFTYCQAGKSLLLQINESPQLIRTGNEISSALVPSIVSLSTLAMLSMNQCLRIAENDQSH